MSSSRHSEQPDERPGERSGGPGGGPAGERTPTDEEWAAFLREAADGGGADVPKEPSARARMVTRRLREQDAAGARGGRGSRRTGRARSRRSGAPADTVPGWRAWPEEPANRRARRRRWAAAVGVTLAVALAVVAVRPSLLPFRLPGLGTDSAASPSPAGTGRPKDAPGESVPGAATVAHPFRGSPAERWAQGPDAVELPEARALAGLSEAEVARGLRRAKEFLVAANLDASVLRGGTPRRALALLDPQQPDLRRALRAPDREADPTMLISRFDPAEARLAGDVIKVRGRMTAVAGRPGEVKVRADYTFVYPLVRAGGGRPGADEPVERTVVRRDITFLLADPRRWDVTEGRLTLETYDVRSYNDACDVYDGYFHPGFPGSRADGAPATGPTVDPYDRRDGMGRDGECATVSRS